MSELNDAIAQMLVLATRLRTHTEKLKDSHIKSMADELLVQLAELQINFEAFTTEHAALKAQLQSAANPGGERCPRCHEIGWKIASTRQDKAGRTVQTYLCKSCKLKEEVVT
jgi:Zn finger protein HypA/HybF involved in hydrogenase expression